MRTAIIFANGELPFPDKIHALMQPDYITIVADGGYRHVKLLGIRPDHLVGDLDSIAEKDLLIATNSGTTMHLYPTNKDQTDLELSLDLAVSLSIQRIFLVGSFGGRADHYLANVFLLFLDKYQSVEIMLCDGNTTIGRIGHEKMIRGTAGDLLSLLPWGKAAEGVITEGLVFPLQGETLFQGSPRGMSNQMSSGTAFIRLEKGELLYIHTKK